MPPAEVELWTDGSGTTNGPIGFAWTLVHKQTGRIVEDQAGAFDGTNNRAELLAVIHGLQALRRPCAVVVITDSEYVAKPFPSGWVDRWKYRQWRKVKNVDLWQQLDDLVAGHRVAWRWVRGHAGTPLNEGCDRRAGECRRAIIAALDSDQTNVLLPFAVFGEPPQPQLALEAAHAVG